MPRCWWPQVLDASVMLLILLSCWKPANGLKWGFSGGVSAATSSTPGPQTCSTSHRPPQLHATSVDASDFMNGGEIPQIKNVLLQLSAMTGRGQWATAQQREEVETLTARLQDLTAGGPPFKNSDMVGNWTLVYSSSQAFRSSPFFASLQSLIGDMELSKRIYAFTDALPNARVGSARQDINAEGKQLTSRVELSVWPFQLLNGKVETIAKIVNDDIGERLEVLVERTGVVDSTLGRLSPRLESWSVPVDYLSERLFDRIPRVTLQNVFLDEEFRITRLADGTLLLYVRDYD